MNYLLAALLTFSAIAQTSYICEIDSLDAQFTDDTYLLVETSVQGKIQSIMAIPLRTSHYDEMTRLDSCSPSSDFLDLTLCADSNRFNQTESTYVKFEEGNKVLNWWGSIFSENYYLQYNCSPSK